MATLRYGTLDTLRGTAAIGVVLYHAGSVRLEQQFVPHGYLAVDFFFVLSGFVMASAYQGALRTSLSLRAFTVKRLIRLYPLAVLGAGMGLAVLLMKWWLYPDKVGSLGHILLSGAFSALLLPTLVGRVTPRHETFPPNGPLWTLFFELAANLAWAWLAVRTRTATLLLVSFICWVVLVVLAVEAHTVNLGLDIATLAGGLARVGFGFPLGIVIYRWRRSRRMPARRFGPVTLSIVLAAALAGPWPVDEPGVPWWDFACVTVILPLIVVLGSGEEAAGRFGALLGDVSYPLYTVHFPVLLVASGLSQTVMRGWNGHAVAAASLGGSVVVAIAAWWFYDSPVRRLASDLAIRHGLFRLKAVAPGTLAEAQEG